MQYILIFCAIPALAMLYLAFRLLQNLFRKFKEQEPEKSQSRRILDMVATVILCVLLIAAAGVMLLMLLAMITGICSALTIAHLI